MMPLGAPSISKYGSLVRPDTQIVALRALRLRRPLKQNPTFMHRNQRTAHAAAALAGTGGRIQPVLMRHTPQLSVKTRGGGGGCGGGCLGGVGWRV